MSVRFAKIRADRVQVGHLVRRSVRPQESLDPVVAVHPSASGASLRLVYGSGAQSFLPAEFIVEVEDESGLLQLKEDVEVHGPYVTSCTMDPERSGSIHFANVRTSGRYVVKADLVIRRDDQTVIRLDSVELGHIRDMAADLVAQARAAESPCGCIDPQGCAEDGPCR